MRYKEGFSILKVEGEMMTEKKEDKKPLDELSQLAYDIHEKVWPICERVKDFDDWLFAHPFFHQQEQKEISNSHEKDIPDENDDELDEDEPGRSQRVVDELTKAITGIR
jgi:hypothetical protein